MIETATDTRDEKTVRCDSWLDDPECENEATVDCVECGRHLCDVHDVWLNSSRPEGQERTRGCCADCKTIMEYNTMVRELGGPEKHTLTAKSREEYLIRSIKGRLKFYSLLQPSARS